jgi:nicotinamide-nucleotide amidase|tara:strand:- start:8 stop:478 length:471 start_codon:yes stop_codon:yes gene_type:complete
MQKKIQKILMLLKKKKIELSTAESCTGGMLAQAITSISGASRVFKFGIVTYSNQSKTKYLKVPSKIIKRYGAVSEECCTFMLKGLAKISKTKINLAITGIAGPNGGTKQKPIGLVYIGIRKNKKIRIDKFFFKNQSRENIRKNSVKKSLELIVKFI